MLQRFTAKSFIKYIEESRIDFLKKCREINKRDKNTKEDIKLSLLYYPKELKKYGYYFYNLRTGEYFWSKTK